MAGGILTLAGGIGLFLLGMTLLSDGLKAFAGDSLRAGRRPGVLARLTAAVWCYIWTMARKSNVNPDHYKTAGRDPQGQAVVHEVERQKFREKKARVSRTKKAGAGRAPGAKG